MFYSVIPVCLSFSHPSCCFMSFILFVSLFVALILRLNHSFSFSDKLSLFELIVGQAGRQSVTQSLQSACQSGSHQQPTTQLGNWTDEEHKVPNKVWLGSGTAVPTHRIFLAGDGFCDISPPKCSGVRERGGAGQAREVPCYFQRPLRS